MRNRRLIPLVLALALTSCRPAGDPAPPTDDGGSVDAAPSVGEGSADPHAPLDLIRFVDLPKERISIDDASEGTRTAPPLLALDRTQLADLTVVKEEGSIVQIRDINLADPEIGSIEFRLRLRTGRSFQMQVGDALQRGAVPFSVPNNKAFLTFRYHHDELRSQDLQSFLEQLVFAFPETPPGDLEFASLRILPPPERFPGSSGITKVFVGRELRRSVYVAGDGYAAFVDVPVSTDAVLSTRLARRGAGGSLELVIEVEQGGQKQTLFGTQELFGDRWVSVRLPLKDLSSGPATFHLSARGDRNAVALFGMPTLFRPVAEPTYVVLYLIDTTGAKHVSAYNSSLNNAPTLRNLAERGVLFENAYAQATHTLPSTVSLMTGQVVGTHGIGALFSRLTDAAATLAEFMARAGYYTASLVTNVSAGERAGLDQGFDVLFDFAYRQASTTRHRTLPRSTLFPWLAAHRDRNLFVYVHTAEPHAPYGAPAEFLAMVGLPSQSGRAPHPITNEDVRAAHDPARLVEIMRHYHAEIRFADDALAALVRELRRLGMWERTLLVVTADHGESFREHRGVLHTLSPHQEQIRVPLIVTGPRCPGRGVRVTENVSLIDILPTLLDFVGVARPAGLDGVSLLPLMKRQPVGAERPVFSTSLRQEHSVILGDWKLIRSEQRQQLGVPTELYDLHSDPGERHNLARSRPHKVAELSALLDALPRRSSPVPADVELTPEQVEELRALGYVE